jgi:hypothetical protein
MLHTDLAPVVTTPFPAREGGAFKPLPASLRGWGGVRSGSDFTNRIINSPSNSKSRINLRSCTILNKRQSLDILVPRLNLGTRVCGLLPPVYGNWCKISNKSQILHHSQQEAEPRYSRSQVRYSRSQVQPGNEGLWAAASGLWQLVQDLK